MAQQIPRDFGVSFDRVKPIESSRKADPANLKKKSLTHEQRPGGQIQPTAVSRDISNNSSRQPHLPQDKQNVVQPSLFSARAVAPLDSKSKVLRRDQAADSSTSANVFGPRHGYEKLNRRTDLMKKLSLDRPQSTHTLNKSKKQRAKENKRKCCNSLPFWPCCALLSVLGALAVLAGLAALLAVLFVSHQSTDTSMTTNVTPVITTITITPNCTPIFPSNTGLVAYFPMDSSPFYLTDVGGSPTATAVSVTNVAGERNQSLSFLGTLNSYFQISNLVSLGTVNNPFSIALYVNPNVLSGTVVHVSIFQNGTDGWCLPFIGFANDTKLAIQIWGSTTAKFVFGPIVPLNSWTHVAQTWSTTSGLSLYVNGVLYAQDSTVTSYPASGGANFLTLASTLQAIPYPASGCSTTGPLGGLGYFNGLLDELRLYSRVLNASEVCGLANY